MARAAAAWAALAVGLQLWAAAHGVPAQVMSTSNTLEPGSRCPQNKYFHKTAQRCCSMCPPGQHVKHFCTETTDTVCADCEDSTYTGLWNWVPRCLSCGAPCSFNQNETQACTREQNRACTCRSGWYCMLGKPDSCRLCMSLRECGPGYGVSRQGTWNSDVLCAPCAPGTFSDTVSSTDMCMPHRACDVLAVPGNASMDAVCLPSTPGPGPEANHTAQPTPGPGPGPEANHTAQPTPGPGPGPEANHTAQPTPGPGPGPEANHTAQPPTSGPQPVEPRTGPGPAVSTALPFPRGTKPPAESSRASVSLPIGLIVGVTALGLLLVGLVNCVILTQKKKKLFCLPGEAKMPHLPAEKEKEQQQHLLTTTPSSSSSSLENSASGMAKGTPARHRAQTPATDQAAGPGAAWASSRGSESPSGGHGTQVKVTCFVSVCGSSEHGSRCSSRDSSTVGDTDANPAGFPDEQVPFSKEERPFHSQAETPETLLQSPQEKPLPLGVPDAGMKAS